MILRPPRWQEEGEEPDYRFTLANERTFLGWLRTALSLLAGSVALVQLAPSFGLTGTRTALAVLLAVTGTALPVFAYRRWAGFQHAMRLGRPLPPNSALLIIGLATTLIGLLILILLLTTP